MKPNFWNSLDNIYWKRVWLCIFSVAGGWGAMIIWLPDHYFKPVAGILGSLTIGLGILIRGSKFIKDRNEIPQVPGVPI